MAQTINTNVASLNAQRNLNTSQSSLATSMQRLSSGLRINSAKDDAAGLAIADRMNAQVRGINVAIRNANDGVSLAQTADGALATITDVLQRMRELAVQSAKRDQQRDGPGQPASRVTALSEEIDRIACDQVQRHQVARRRVHHEASRSAPTRATRSLWPRSPTPTSLRWARCRPIPTCRRSRQRRQPPLPPASSPAP